MYVCVLPTLIASCYSAIPASALNEDDDDDDDGTVNDVRDDERSGTRYNVCPCMQLTG